PDRQRTLRRAFRSRANDHTNFCDMLEVLDRVFQIYQIYYRMGPMYYADWKLFIDCAELGSLSKVALVYGTSQPNISRQISELEKECGGRLFERTGRGVVLTELGDRITPKVRAWMVSNDAHANNVHT